MSFFQVHVGQGRGNKQTRQFMWTRQAPSIARTLLEKEEDSHFPTSKLPASNSNPEHMVLAQG